MTKGEIYEAVKAMSKRPRLTDSELNMYRALTEADFRANLRGHPRNGVVAEWTSTADPDTGEYSDLVPIPEDMGEMVKLMQGEQLYEQYPASTEVTAGHGFISRGKCFQVYPKPSSDTTYTIHYRAFLPSLVNSWDSNWVSTYFPNAYIYGMLTELGVAVVHDRRAEWRQEFLRIINDLRRQGWNQNIAASPRMRAHG